MNKYIPFEEHATKQLEDPNKYIGAECCYILKDTNIFVANIFERLGMGENIDTIADEMDVEPHVIENFMLAIGRDIQEAQDRELACYEFFKKVEKEFPQYTSKMTHCPEGDPRYSRTISVFNVPQEKEKEIRDFVNDINWDCLNKGIFVHVHVVNKENTKKYYPEMVRTGNHDE